MYSRTIVQIGFALSLAGCGSGAAETAACLDDVDAAWEVCADDCDSSYPDESDDAAWEACMNGCDMAAEFETDDC